MEKRMKTVLALVGVIAALALMTGVVVDAEESGGEAEQKIEKVKKVQVVKKGACEGDCPHAEKHRIVIVKGGDGHPMMGEECDGDCSERIVVEKAGDASHVHVHGGHHMRFDVEDCEGEDCKQVHRVFISEDGDLSEVHAKAGHDFDWIEAECEGEDCKKVRKVVVKKGDAPVEIHTLGEHDFDWIEAECEGDDCDKHRVMIKTIGSPHGHSRAHTGDHAGRRGGFLGVQLTELTPELRAHFGVSAEQGVMIGKVMDESAAAGAGLAVGDIVTSVNGEAVSSAASMSGLIARMEPGETVALSVWRSGSPMDVNAVLGESQRSPAKAMRRIVVVCDEGDEDCDAEIRGASMDFDCGGAEKCEVEVECEGEEECECSVNGESVDCGELGLPEELGR